MQDILFSRNSFVSFSYPVLGHVGQRDFSTFYNLPLIGPYLYHEQVESIILSQHHIHNKFIRDVAIYYGSRYRIDISEKYKKPFLIRLSILSLLFYFKLFATKCPQK